MKKNNYLLPFSILFALGIANKSNAQEALKSAASTETKSNISSGFMALEGRIMDTGNEFVGNAQVTLKGAERTTTADAYGNYRFAELQPGTYTMIVSREGYESYEMTVTIAMPNMKVEAAKVYSTPNSKSISASPIIKDVVMKRSSV